MGKFINDAVFDEALEVIKNNCNLMTVCSSQPTNRTEAVSTYALADVEMSDGDFTIEDGVTGRKCVVSAKYNITIDGSGDCTHVALCDDTRLLCVTTCVTTTLTASMKLNTPLWNIKLPDPT